MLVPEVPTRAFHSPVPHLPARSRYWETSLDSPVAVASLTHQHGPQDMPPTAIEESHDD
jgi:hypothetical protein